LFIDDDPELLSAAINLGYHEVTLCRAKTRRTICELVVR
jgi:hypothetical protein